MSLLDGPDVITLYPEVLGTDGDGNRLRVPGVTPVTVRGRMQRLPHRTGTLVQAAATVRVFLCRSFPAGEWSRVEYQGRTWDVEGEPEPHGLSQTTTHVRVLLRARDPQPLLP